MRCDPSLPRGLKRHLQVVEESLLDSLAWEPGSSLFPAITAACGPPAGGPAAADDDAAAPLQRGPSGTFEPPPPALPFCRGAAPPAGGDAAAHAVVSAFLGKMLKLAALRLRDLASRLDLGAAGQGLLAQAFTATRHAAVEHTWLLYGRRLDQAALCALYGVLRANQVEGGTFKAILQAYREQPHARADTFRAVSMAGRADSGREAGERAPTGDVIAFYNQIFLPAVKPALLGLAVGSVPLAPLPLPPPRTSPPAGGSPAARRGAPAASSPARGADVVPGVVKFSPGRWRTSSMGTQLITPPTKAEPAGAPSSAAGGGKRKGGDGGSAMGPPLSRPRLPAPELDGSGSAAVASGSEASGSEGQGAAVRNLQRAMEAARTSF